MATAMVERPLARPLAQKVDLATESIALADSAYTDLTFAQRYYPNYVWQRERLRAYGYLRWMANSHEVVVTQESGHAGIFPDSDTGYEQCVRYLCQHNLTVFAALGDSAARFPWLERAVYDEHCNVMVTERTGVIGMTFRRRKHTGAIYTDASWRQMDTAGVMTDKQMLVNLRHFASDNTVGAYDTPAAAGSAILYKYWRDTGLSLLARLPSGLEDALLRYRIGGHIEAPGEGRSYELLHESDIRSAYPTVVAMGLPWGGAAYHINEPPRDCPASYGVVRFRVESALPYSPVPMRDWSRHADAVSWSLEEGEYEMALWHEEIATLRALDIRVQWLYGWSWPTLSQALKPWVDSMWEMRDFYRAHSLPQMAELTKLATNAAIGKWGIATQPITLVPADQAQEGDWFVSLPRWSIHGASDNLPPSFMMHRADTLASARPLHWHSYVMMAVRMEVFRIAMRERYKGVEIPSIATDAIYSTQPIDTSDSPFSWKRSYHQSALIPYPGAIVSDELEKLPGQAKATRPKRKGGS